MIGAPRQASQDEAVVAEMACAAGVTGEERGLRRMKGIAAAQAKSSPWGGSAKEDSHGGRAPASRRLLAERSGPARP